MASDAFASLATEVAADLSIPDARIVVVEHPIGGTPDEGLEARADRSIDALVRKLSAEGG